MYDYVIFSTWRIQRKVCIKYRIICNSKYFKEANCYENRNDSGN